MKTLAKIQRVRNWLLSGKAITDEQARSHFNYHRLASGINRLRESGMWIINIGNPGKFAKYILVEQGPIRNLMVKGHRINIIGAHYTNGLADMSILIEATNGAHHVTFRVKSDAFRSREVMKKAITENLDKIR